MQQPTFFKAIVKAGIQYGNHCSDLYVPDTKETRAILAQFPEIMMCTRFTHNEYKTTWIDVPFAYDPYWELRNVQQF
jgi:hypothetical protein